MNEIYVSTDVETDGPIPGPHSMLSFASAAFLPSGEMSHTFSVNLEGLPNSAGDPDTMKWWETQPIAWAECRKDIQPPQRAILEYVNWLDKLDGKPVFVGYPAGFDFLFVYWYLIRFAGRSPFSFSALDVKTYASAMLRKPYRKCTKRRFPQRWFSKRPHTHVALDDAIEQGEMFINMLRENTGQ